MPGWVRQLRAALGMGLTWAIGWGVVGGVLKFLANIFPGLNVVDMWIQALALPGFFAGTIFSLMLRAAATGRTFNELSVPRFALLGAIGGILLGGLAMATFGVSPDRWLRAVTVLSTLSLVSAASASGTLLLARMGEGPRALDRGTDAPGGE